MAHLSDNKRVCANDQVINGNYCDNCNFSTDSLDASIDCFEDNSEISGQGSNRIPSNVSSLKFIPGCELCPLQENLSNVENQLDEMMERMEVMMVEETKRLQREEARMNNIPLLDFADSDEEIEEKRTTPEIDSLEVSYHNNANNSNNENFYRKVQFHSNISTNNYVEKDVGNGHKLSANEGNTNNSNSSHCAKSKHHSSYLGHDSNLQHHPQVDGNQYHPPSNPVNDNPRNLPLYYINNHNDLNATLHNSRSSNCDLPKINNSNSQNIPPPVTIDGGSRNMWDKGKNHSTIHLNQLPQTIKTEGVTENLKPIFDKRFIYKASEPKSYTKMFSNKVKYNLNKEIKKKQTNHIKLNNFNDISFSNEKEFIESNSIHSKENYLNNNNSFMHSELVKNNSRCHNLEMNFNANSSFIPNQNISSQMYTPNINSQMYIPTINKQMDTSNIDNHFPNLNSIDPIHSSKTNPHANISSMSKTISAPLLTRRRPPHRVKPLDSQGSLKVTSVSAPLNRKMKALPDLWQALNQDSQNNSTDVILTNKTSQSERVDFVTPDFLNEFTHSANKKKTAGNCFSRFINKRSSVTQLEPVETRNGYRTKECNTPTDINPPFFDADRPPSLSGTSHNGQSRSLAGDYRRYTLEEYKRLKQEMQLGINKGSLGPDMQTNEYKERKEKIEKQKEYAQKILERNRKQIESSKYRSQPNLSQGDQTKKEALPDKRKLAIEYAKTIPKPKVVAPKMYSWPKDSKINNNKINNNINNISQRDQLINDYSNLCNEEITREEFLLSDMDNIRWMKERHDQERQQIAKLLPKT